MLRVSGHVGLAFSGERTDEVLEGEDDSRDGCDVRDDGQLHQTKGAANTSRNSSESHLWSHAGNMGVGFFSRLAATRARAGFHFIA